MFRARLRSFYRSLVQRSEMERELSDELQFHLERRADDLAARGMARAEAMRTARLEFGSPEKYKEETRASRGLRFVDELRSDLRYAWRSLGKNKGFAAYVVSPEGEGLFNVRVGNFPARPEAERISARLRDEEKFKPFIVKP